MQLEPTPRLKDVLFALAAATEVGQPLGRLPLQKLVYLADVLSPIWREVAKPSGFVPYRNGPYDLRIQNTVDSLVFRGFVEVSVPNFRRIDNVECQYSLSRTGSETIKHLSAKPGLQVDLNLFREIVTEVSRRGWENIKALVYAEPTYDTARATANSERLRIDSPTLNLSREFLRDLRYALQGPKGEPVSSRNLVQLFFAVLAQHMKQKAVEDHY
jgi:uncharacterized protein YwgA